MKIAADWLNDYLTRKLSVAELATALEEAGVEVEGIVASTKLDDKIVVGQVAKLEPHPQADRLQVASVDVKDATLQIVCGAPNIAVGQKVPVALEGARLPDGSAIAAAKLRGVESHGMICSEQELGLSQNHAGIMVLADGTALGQKVSSILSHSDVIDTTTAANRWDLNGVVGLSREIAAHSNQKLLPPQPEQLSSSTADFAAVTATELVARFQVAHLKVDVAKPTPTWMEQRLLASGTRSINVVVDITNYVMLESGQPLHAFDAAKIKPPINVRLAAAGEQLVSLDGVTRKLEPTDLLIADSTGPVGLAGVMGGKNSEIDASTTAIYLEAASFDGPTLRRTAARLGLRTDASARFERRLPVDLAPIALARAVELLTEHAAAKLVDGPVDHLSTPPVQTRIAVQPARVSQLLGITLDAAIITTELAKLEFGVEASTDLTVTPPWWRPDVQQEADVAEEVIKLIGYQELPATLPAWAPAAIDLDRRWPALWQAKAALRSLGLFEVVTYSFISEAQITALGRATKDHLKLQNPLSIEQAYLRTDLLPSLLQVAAQNRTYGRQFGVFEISKVYHPHRRGELPEEPTHLAVLVRRDAGSYRTVKAALDRLAREYNVNLKLQLAVPEAGVAHPTRAATISLGDAAGNQQIGWIGQLHPVLVADAKISGELGYLELDWLALVSAATPKIYRQLSRFPAITRDLSLVIDRSITWQQVAEKLANYQATFLNDYYGEDLPPDKKALALRLSFDAPDRTLTDAEGDQRLQQALDLLKQAFSATERR